MHQGSYAKFALMMGVSFLVMYAVMFLNMWEADHIYLSQARSYMITLMIASMAVVMLSFMWSMYPSKKLNWGILIGSSLLFLVALFFIRTQDTVGDEAWMHGMISHHSSAILTSERAKISDPQARQLAGEIIKTQREEIAEMKAILARLEASPGR